MPVRHAFDRPKCHGRCNLKNLQISVGATALCQCNGELLEKAFKVPATGGIGLQAESGKFEFRRIRIKEMP